MAESRDTNRNWDIRPKHVVIGVLVLLLLVFAILNTNQVNVDFLFADTDLALIFVIVASALIGFAAGWIIRARGN
jgi:uncharacterized integral membrane protein